MKKVYLVKEELSEGNLKEALEEVCEILAKKINLQDKKSLLIVGSELEKEAIILTGAIMETNHYYLGKINIFLLPELKGWMLISGDNIFLSQ